MLLILFSILFVSYSNAQCNCITITNTSISTLFPGNTSSATGFCRQVSGILTIDKNFEFISSELQMLPGSRIVISSGKSLYINNTKIQNCTNFWDGIFLENYLSGIFSSNNSDIKGAMVGIDCAHSGNVILSNTNIINCIDGLLLKNNTYASIQNCTFDQIGHWGIEFTNSNNGYLLLSNTAFNNFNQLTFPVICNSGTMNLKISNNCSFSGAAWGYIQTIGITGEQIIQNSTFDNSFLMAIDIKNSYGPININNNTFTNCSGSVYLHEVYGGSSEINNNNISNGVLGIRLNANAGSVHNNIKFNTIINCSEHGILYSQNLVNHVGTTISDNIIRNFNSNFSFGIKLEDARNVTIKDNKIFNALSNNSCISFLGGSNNYCNGNSINAEIFQCDNTIGDGIIAASSQNNTYTCNKTNNRLFGFRSTGASDYSTLTTNNFLNHSIGLLIENASAIGVQQHHWNTWNGAYSSGFGAVNQNTNPIDISNSKFIVATSVGSPYHPQNSGNGFFQQAYAELPNEVPCGYVSYPEEQHGLRANIKNSIDGLINDNFYAAVNYDSKAYTYKLLDENASLRSEVPLYENFYSENKENSIGKFNDLLKNWNNYQITVPFPNFANTYQDYSSKLNDYISLKNSNANAINIENARLILNSAELQLSNEKSENISYLLSAALKIKNALNNINTSSIYESNIKDYYNIYFSTLANNSNILNEEQKNILYNIAIQCPLTGGKIVYTARSFYQSLFVNSNFSDNISCQPINQRETKTDNVFSLLKMYPNPTIDELNIDLGKNQYLNNLQLIIYDLSGKNVKSYALQQNNGIISCSLLGLQNGVYIVRLSDKNGEIFRDKLSIIK